MIIHIAKCLFCNRRTLYKEANIKVVDYRMIGANGRVYLAGDEAEIRNARDAAENSLRNAGAV